MSRSIVLLLIATLLVSASFNRGAYAQRVEKVEYIPFEEAQPILESLKDELPRELGSASSQIGTATWMRFVTQRDSEIRSRLAQGDEDSLINFLLFGTSFTRNPRITLSALATVAGKPWREAPGSSPATAAFTRAVNARVDDLVRAMAAPTSNERLLFARRMVVRKGYDLKVTAGRDQTTNYLLANLARMLNEQVAYGKLLESARVLGDPSAEFAERSRLYSARGLSSDTSLLPNFAIEKALLSIKAQGLLPVRSVRRVAIIGPGLDFTDKEDGYDFYPQQTIQPFAIIDTLLRTGLAAASELRVTTLDLSPRVNDHLHRAHERGRRGEAYTIQLPRDLQGLWKAEAVDYWSHFGDRIGKSVAAVAVPPGIGDLKVRAVSVRPQVVSMITPKDVNIVLQRLNLQPGDAFDLVIATNIFVYYDVFEQSLALANVSRMLRPGGLLLSNNALLELPSTGIRSVGYETVVYSDRPDHGDHIVWYQREVPR